MTKSRLVVIGRSILAGALVVLPIIANAGHGLQGKTSGFCTLTNMEAEKELYNGKCTIGEKINGSTTIYEIKMGDAESFLFATSDNGKTWMHGPDSVNFNDRGDNAVFSWDDFRLEVYQD